MVDHKNHLPLRSFFPYKNLLHYFSPNSLFAVPSGPPTRVAVSALSSTSISVSWDLPLRQDRNGDITGYVINVTNLDSGVIQQFTAAMATNITISNLRPFTIYVTTVSAQTAVGMGPFSSVSSVQTLEDGRLKLHSQKMLSCKLFLFHHIFNKN